MDVLYRQKVGGHSVRARAGQAMLHNLRAITAMLPIGKYR